MENAGTKPHPLWQANDLVFSETGKPMDAGNVLRQYFWPWLKKARPPHIRFHDRRRTAATLLMDQGIHSMIVSEILGHSKIGITLDLYSHTLPAMHHEAATAMDAILRG